MSMDLLISGASRWRLGLMSVALACGLSACGGLKTEGDEPGEFRGSVPADGAVGVDVDNEIVVIFNEAVTDDSASAQAADGACEDKPIQVSKDDFATCVGGVATIVANADKHKIQFVPAAPLAVSTLYKVKVTKAVNFDSFLPLAEDTTVSFTTKADESDGVRSYLTR